MAVAKFKVGDIVRRTNGEHFGMDVGDIATIIEVTEHTHNVGYRLKEYKGTHSQDSFELYKEAEEKVEEDITPDIEIDKVKEIADKLKGLKTSDIEDKIYETQEYINRYKRTIEDLHMRVNRNYRELKERMFELEVLESKKDDGIDFTSEIEAILEHPVVKSIKVHNNKEYSIFTDYIDIYDEKGNRFRGNTYELRFNYNRMNCRIYGLDPDLCRKSYWSAKDPHPHVCGDTGSACWGDAGSMLSMNQNEYELYASFIVVFNFLQQVNTGDVAGKNICNWDCIDEDDNDLDNPYENHYDCECHICYEQLNDGDDNCYFCDDCERHVCDTCITWIESEGRYVCDDCVNENYTKCDECGEYEKNENMTEINGYDYCNVCRDEDFDTCSECGEYHRKCDITEIDGREYCDDCRRSKYTQCGACYEWYENNEITRIDGDEYCDSCRDDRFAQCDECREWHEDTFECSECGGTFCECCRENKDGMCESCFEENEECEDEE